MSDDNTTESPTSPTPLASLPEQLGIERFTKPQRQAIEALIAGHNVLAVLPTGAGKSAIYQAAAESIEGPTVVVSPLLALQHDQRQSIDRRGLSATARITGASSASARRRVLGQWRRNRIEYLFVTPETLLTNDVQEAMADQPPSLFVVDEAHCVVTWGRKFRPAFARLGEIRRRLGDPTTVALTASADQRMRADIIASLALVDPVMVSEPVQRPEIRLAVTLAADQQAAEAELLEALTDHADDDDGADGADPVKTVVYVPRRALAESLAESLPQNRTALAYHGGMKKADRTAVAAEFADSPDAVIFATNAFGLGIDIGDIGAVHHLDMPATLVDYYQEIGRGGRDGRTVEARAFVTVDKASRRRFSGGASGVDPATCLLVAAAIQNGVTSQAKLRSHIDGGAAKVTGALDVLQSLGLVRTHPTIRWEADDTSVDADSVAEICRTRDEFFRSQMEAVSSYVAATTCRWSALGAALGEPVESCGHCDVCEQQIPATDNGEAGSHSSSHSDSHSDSDVDGWTGRRVEHPQFGPGLVVHADADTLTVSFDTAGPKRLDLELTTDLDGFTTTDDQPPGGAG